MLTNQGHSLCTRQFLVALVFADLHFYPPSFQEMIYILVPFSSDTSSNSRILSVYIN